MKEGHAVLGTNERSAKYVLADPECNTQRQNGMVKLDRNHSEANNFMVISRGQNCMRTKVVGADLERLLLAHQQPNLSGVIALQQPDLANAALLPLARIIIKAVQLALTADRCNAF